MESILTILERMREAGDAPALFYGGEEYSYRELLERAERWSGRLAGSGIGRGTVCGFFGDYSPEVCALILALLSTRAILVPFTEAARHDLDQFLSIAGVEYLFRFDADENWTLERFDDPVRNELTDSFLAREVPGLIVFSSGSTGKPKGILQDCERVMRKFVAKRQGWRTALFLMMDHFGGFNTLLSTFAYGGTGICLPDRNPDNVCRVLEKGRATLLPTTPTFLNMLIASRSYGSYDLSSVRLITYGTEVMSEPTLNKVGEIFPNAQIKQTYGLSELGVLRSKSESDHSVWVKIGGDGFELKVVDNTLWIRSEANMVGYLNAPNPFDDEGWMCTGDEVEVRGEYLRILGRKSEMINVGGQKVFPVDVEAVLIEAENVREASVVGIPHPIMGQAVKARITLEAPEERFQLAERLRKHCLERLPRYKVPTKFEIVSDEEQHNPRFKKVRKEKEQNEEVPLGAAG